MPKSKKDVEDSGNSDQSGAESGSEEEEYVVEKVVNKRMRNGRVSIN